MPTNLQPALQNLGYLNNLFFSCLRMFMLQHMTDSNGEQNTHTNIDESAGGVWDTGRQTQDCYKRAYTHTNTTQK